MQLNGHQVGSALWALPNRDFSTFFSQQRSQWNHRLGGHQDEFLALSRERDPELYYEGLLNLGARLETEDRLDSAGELYAFLSSPHPGPPIPSSIQHRAQERMHAITGSGAAGPRAEFLLRRLAREAVEPSTLMGLTAASATFRLTRLAVLSRLTSSASANFLTRGIGAQASAGVLGFFAEAAAFPLATRMGAAALGRDLDWNPNLVAREVASSFLVLGAMKLTGWGAGAAYQRSAGRGLALPGPIQQGAMLGGILLGHRLEETVGLRAHVDGATTLTDSLALLLQFNVAGRLAQGAMGKGFSSWERSLVLQAESLGRSHPRPWWPISGGEPILAAAGRAPAIDRMPVEGDLIERSNLVLMARGKGSGSDKPSKPSSLPSMLRHVSLFRDVRSVKLALRALWIGTTGPLREAFITTLERIEAGETHGLLVRDLLSDPRLAQTQFLSQDLQRRLTEQIHDLRRVGGNRDSGVFFFNLTRGLLEEPTAPRGSNKPVKLTAEALLPLQELRLQELEKLLGEPEASLPFTPKEALGEGVQVARNFARVIQGLLKRKDRDFLTQLRNRADLDRLIPRLEYRLYNFLKYSGMLKLEDHVGMIDIDFFKRVNDTYGHSGGDEVLQESAEILRDPEVIRPRDIIVRYGGEEFLTYFFKSGHTGAQIVAERIRKAFEAHPMEMEGHDPIHVTVSIGVAIMRPLPPVVAGGPPVVAGSLLNAIERADRALLAAKNTGRNRIIFHDDPNIDWATSILNRSGLENRASQLEAGLANALGTDPVTGLANALGAGPVNPRKNWVLMFDIDRLEVINFAYSNLIGDKVLWNIAQSLRDSLSGTPYTSARYGGDKFFVHLETSSREEALDIAERIRKGVANRTTSIEGRQPIHATVSIGAAEMRPLPPSEPGRELIFEGALQNAIERALRALDAAKKAGRNQVNDSSE